MNEKAVFQIIGYKNTGKTTLICKLIKILVFKGYRVGVIKHDAHKFDTDHEGTDTWMHREAGAQVVAITSESRTAMIREQSTSLYDLIEQINGVDIILVEGFKLENYPKLLIIKEEADLELFDKTTHVKGAALWPSIEKLNLDSKYKLPLYSINNAADLLKIVLQVINLKR